MTSSGTPLAGGSPPSSDIKTLDSPLTVKSAMAMKQEWMSLVKNELKKSPIASNAFFGIILVCLLGEVLVFLLMVNIQGTQCGKKMFSSSVPAIMWFIIMFLDGHYFACAMTSWYGSYEFIENAAPQKWCEPANYNSSQEYRIKTKDWYSLSQTIGMGHIILLVFVLKVSGMVPQKKGDGDGNSSIQNKDPEAPETKKTQDKDGSEDIPLQEIKKS